MPASLAKKGGRACWPRIQLVCFFRLIRKCLTPTLSSSNTTADEERLHQGPVSYTSSESSLACREMMSTALLFLESWET